MVQRRRHAHAIGVAGGAQVVEDHLAILGATVGHLRRGLGQRGSLGRGLRGGAGTAGIDRAGGRDALFGALGRGRRHLGRNPGVQVGGKEDEAEGDGRQQRDHHGEAFQELQIVIPHSSLPLADSRWTTAERLRDGPSIERALRATTGVTAGAAQHAGPVVPAAGRHRHPAGWIVQKPASGRLYHVTGRRSRAGRSCRSHPPARLRRGALRGWVRSGRPSPR